MGLVIFALVLLWGTVSAALFAMWSSVALGLIGIGLIARRRPRPLALFAFGISVAPLLVAQFVLVEFAEELEEMACLTRAAQGLESSCSVDPEDTGPLFNSRQHGAVRWLNAHMAVGGWLLGFREVARETWLLDSSSSAERQTTVQAETMKTRRRYCLEGAAAFGPTHRRDGDFVMDAKAARSAAAKLAKQTRDGQRRWENLEWPGTYQEHPWHVVLALLVPDSRLHAERKGEQLEMMWAGGIQYPPHLIAQKQLPRPLGSGYTLALDEAVFCGLQMDGVFVPYRMEWTWQMDRNDARLASPVDQPRWTESVLR